MSTTLRTLILALLLLVPAAPAAAQVGPRGPVDREQLEERVRARMAQMIQERLALSEEEGARMRQILQETHERRRELRMEERALRRRLGAWADQGEGADAAEARAILERMADLRVAEVDLFRAEQDRLLEFLTPRQVLTFHVLRQRMGERIQELRGGRGGPGGPGGGRGPGGPEGGFGDGFGGGPFG